MSGRIVTLEGVVVHAVCTGTRGSHVDFLQSHGTTGEYLARIDCSQWDAQRFLDLIGQTVSARFMGGRLEFVKDPVGRWLYDRRAA